MKCTRVTDIEQPFFMQAWKLYNKSFPAEERRQLQTQKKLIQNSQYYFELFFNQDKFIGFIAWWQFNDIRYIEHFATLPNIRGNGYGLRILQDFIASSHIPVLLEVELPTRDIDKRRIGFYKRAGFVLNEHHYKHPPYKKGGDYIYLKLMTYPNAITDKELQFFLEICHPVIHQFVLF